MNVASVFFVRISWTWTTPAVVTVSKCSGVFAKNTAASPAFLSSGLSA